MTVSPIPRPGEEGFPSMPSTASTIDTIAALWASSIDPLVGDKAFSDDIAQGRFSNPAAYHVHNTARAVAAFVIEGEGEDAALTEIEDMGRLFALRVTEPSSSLACFFDLRDLVARETADVLSADQAGEAASRVDACMLHAIDAYASAREKIAQISIGELKKRNEMLEKMSNASSLGFGEV